MTLPDHNDVVLQIGAAPLRRVVLIAALYALAVAVIYFSLARPQSILGMIWLVLVCAVLFWLAQTVRRTSARQLILTRTHLCDSSGAVLAALDDILQVHRGALALKPSSGFTLLLRSPQATQLAPGLWWRFGRMVGVGGLIDRSATRAMAAALADQLANRDRVGVGRVEDQAH